MPENPDSQKNISKGYAGNLSYFRRPHYWRRLRFLCFSLVVTLCALGVFISGKWGSPKKFNPGPLSQNHAHLVDRCETCHTGSGESLGVDLFENITKLASMSSLEAMDAACMTCHPGTGLHAPQIMTVGFSQVSQGLVHASSCASCHREHAGPHRMALPSNQTCTDCHGSLAKLHDSRTLPKQTPSTRVTPLAAAGGQTVDLGEGLRVFLPPARAPESLAAFESFAHGHPGFGYESPEARDPSDLKFNHARHFRADIPKLNNAKLDCASCHQPDANGVFYQPVRYEKHCQECHSLQIQQSLPDLHIPHGDSRTVKLFLAGLDSSIESSVRASGVNEPVAVSLRVKEEREALQRRGLLSVDDMVKRVFLQGDPQDLGGELLMRSGKPKFLTECAKCHTVTGGDAGSSPEVQPPLTPTRWLAKGAFNHQPHNQSACTDCHGAALKSKLTSDILLPTQQSCVECHQPLTSTGKEGVKFSCQNCHHFHSSFTPPVLEAAVHPASPTTPALFKP